MCGGPAAPRSAHSKKPPAMSDSHDKQAVMAAATVDAITVSVVRHRLESIVHEMGEAMLRTSYSQILNSSRDFSTALCDVDGRLVAQAEHVPIHVGAMPWAVV